MSIPTSLCLLRTSAIGDVTHVVPLIRTLQQEWPQTQLTWIIGRLEQKLLGDLAGIEFITFDKSRGWAGIREVWNTLCKRRFDALLHMQVAMRANVLSLGLHAQRRIGYDRARSKELHGLTINERIPQRTGQHVLDALGSFIEPLGLKQTQVRWEIPICAEDHAWAAAQWPDDKPTLLISPCSSHALRNWLPSRYAAVIDHVASRGWQVVLLGGPSPQERTMANAVLSCCRHRPLDLTGKDTLKRLLALLSRAPILLTPDSGPMHMANAVGTKVIGLHAASNPDRSGPYSDRRWCVNRYDAAARNYFGKPAHTIRWGTRIEKTGVMSLIDIESVIERFEACAAHLKLPY
jgi:heptosyltransferase I